MVRASLLPLLEEYFGAKSRNCEHNYVRMFLESQSQVDAVKTGLQAVNCLKTLLRNYL